MSLCGTKEIITDASIKLIFGNVTNFNNLFEAIHKNFNCDDFLELKDMDITDFTDKFLSENNISFDNIRNNKFILKKFVKEAKNYGILYCVISKKSINSEEKSVDVMVRAEDAPPHHDPFDRMLLCQAISNDMSFLTHDSKIIGYDTDKIIFA